MTRARVRGAAGTDDGAFELAATPLQLGLGAAAGLFVTAGLGTEHRPR